MSLLGVGALIQLILPEVHGAGGAMKSPHPLCAQETRSISSQDGQDGQDGRDSRDETTSTPA
jgi:hypothetical protein